MLILKSLSILFIPVFSGFQLINFISRGKNYSVTFKAALAYGLGLGMISLHMLFLGIFNVPMTSPAINLPLLFTAFVLFMLNSRSKKNNKGNVALYKEVTCQTEPLSTLEKYLTILFLYFIGINLLATFSIALSIPVYSWDTLSTHSFNAKVFYFEKSFIYYDTLPHNTYPLHVPFIEAWLNITLGEWDDQVIKIFFPIYALSIIIIQHHFLKNFTNKCWALLGSVFLLSSNFFLYHSSIAYRDFTIMYYNYTALLLLILWFKNHRTDFLIVAAIFSGLTSFVKLEGTGYLFIHIMIFAYMLFLRKNDSLKKRIGLFFTFTIPGLLICLPFHFFKFYRIRQTLRLETSTESKHFDLYNLKLHLSMETFQKIWIVITRILTNMFYSNNWNLTWLIFFISFIHLINKKIQTETKLLLLALLMYFGVYICGYSFTQHFFWISQTETSLSRGILHFFPIITAVIILLNFSNKNKNASCEK